MSKTNVNWKRDKKYFREKGDPGFSPSRNKYIVEKTIKDYEATVLRKQKEHEDALAERVDAVGSYLNNDKAILAGRGIDKYLGPRNLAYMRGQDITNRLRMIDKPLITPQQIVRTAPTLTDFHRRGQRD